MTEQNDKNFPSNWRNQLHEIIFEADTPAGKLFDVVLLWAILLSVLAVMLESVADIRASYGTVLRIAEWIFTILFTIEYIVRIVSVRKPFKYIFSFFGVIDFLAVVPTYLSLLFVGSQYFIVIRAVRLLRVFRIFKLARYVDEAQVLMTALKASAHKIIVFLGGVFTVALVIGALMFLIEGAGHGFTSIPKSMYWAIVTMTTVGYGDIAPATPIGQALSAILMVFGYGMIAVPTGIVSVELSRSGPVSTHACSDCGASDHAHDASYCKHCGAKL